MDPKLNEFLELVWQKRRELKNLSDKERANKIYHLYMSTGKRYKNRSRARQMVEIVKSAHKAIHGGQCYLQLDGKDKERMAKDLLRDWGVTWTEGGKGQIILEKAALLVIYQKMTTALTTNPDVKWPCLGGFWHLGNLKLKATKRLYLNVKTEYLAKCIEGLAKEWNKSSSIFSKKKSFYFKFDNPYGGGEARLDKIVIYLPESDEQRWIETIAKLQSSNNNIEFSSKVPHMLRSVTTKKGILLKGVGSGEEPAEALGGGMSFGSVRAEAVAKAFNTVAQEVRSVKMKVNNLDRNNPGFLDGESGLKEKFKEQVKHYLHYFHVNADNVNRNMTDDEYQRWEASLASMAPPPPPPRR